MPSTKNKIIKTAKPQKIKKQPSPAKNQAPDGVDYPTEREFLFKTFHDLRNPLHTIMGYTNMVLKKTRDQIPEKQQENLEKVLQSAERLREIVDRMVARYRME